MSFTGTTAIGNATISAVANTAGLNVGMVVTGAGIPADATIVSKVTNVSITLSGAATAAGVGVTLVAHLVIESGAMLTNEPTVTDGDTILLIGRMGGAALRTSADLERLPIVNVAVKSGVSNLRSSAHALPLIVINVAVKQAVSSLRSSADAHLLNLLNVTVHQAVVSLLSSAVGICNVIGASDTDGLTVGDVINEILALWGIGTRCSAPEFAITRALNDLNSALQAVWNQADERSYWTNVTLTLSLTDGESSKELPENVQNVVGHCRRADNRRPLVLVGTMGEIENFEDLYMGGQTAGEPVGYYVNRTRASGMNEDPAKCIIMFAPQVQGTTLGILVDVVLEAPRYTKYDLLNGPVIPIPHSYAESLLLPIARYLASSFYLFRSPESKESIDREYLQARMALGMADPLPGKAGDNKDRRKEAVA